MKAVAGEIVTQRGALSARESQQLKAAEADVEKGGSLIVAAMELIRDQRLYRATHDTFADYCRERWDRTVSSVNRAIAREAVVAKISEHLAEENGANFAPRVSPAAAAEVADLPVDQAAAVVKKAAETNGKPTAKAVREARDQVAPKNTAVSAYFTREPGDESENERHRKVTGTKPKAKDNACIDDLLTAKRVVSRKLVDAENALGECEHSQQIAKALESIQRHGEAWKCK